MACFRHLLTPFHASVRKSMKNFEGYKDLLMKKSQDFKTDWETLGKKVERAKLTSAVSAACTLLEKKFKEGKSMSAKQQLVRDYRKNLKKMDVDLPKSLMGRISAEAAREAAE